MAKGQKRSNRETRKPKQDKPAGKSESGLSNTAKIFEKASDTRTKGK